MTSLPSLPALRAFEAAARFGSFRAAAEAINVSPTAISHHIRGLEAQLNVQLFTREIRAVHLTDEGMRLADGLGKAFRLIEASVEAVAQNPGKTKIRMAMGPSFATRWLLPRFAAFHEQFPQVDLELVQTPLLVSPQNVDADIFITWGDGVFPEMIADPLVNVLTAPVASPALVERLGKPDTPEDLLSFPLIHQRDTLGWSAWFTATDVNTSDLRGPVIEDTNVVLQAAIAGQGVVMGWVPLINSELESGSLIQLFDAVLSENRAYYLVRRTSGQQVEGIAEICNWLIHQAR
ncbi:LysR substrate-binding domain-containing protein [Tropicibacter sp. Alg240-R139]|uniref:LysR substrate-binding domain-containing protein n=1 Tax=Tropicibacter sp. Alg240-R139 TaxID=2305991 RepID=UPI0013E092A0|nr:LysR substrate-binding domain-containing protein [Tropicibacter sp. Alg240-R139]